MSAPRVRAVDPWIQDAVIYGVHPRIWGPGLPAIRRQLPRLRHIGVTAVLLPPIQASVPGDFGYAVTDHWVLRSEYGPPEAFAAFVREAHALGLRVLLDFVPNHTSARHRYFVDAERRGVASPFYRYYQRDDTGRAVHYFDWKHLPNLNYAHPAVRESMVEAMRYWVSTYGVDGFRFDVAWGIRARAPRFWPSAVRALRGLKPNIALIAEASARDTYYCRSGFDLAYDWTDQPGRWAWGSVFSEPQQLARRLHASLLGAAERAPHDPRLWRSKCVLRFLNNNDTGKRFVTRHGPAMTRVAAALLLTLPGVPLLYAGDEVGASFMPYDTVAPLASPDRHRLLARYRKLITLRRSLSALRSPYWQPLLAPSAPQIYAYLRVAAGPVPSTDPRCVVVVLNFGAVPATASWSALPTLCRARRVHPVRDLFGDTGVAVWGTSAGLRVTLGAHAAAVLSP